MEGALEDLKVSVKDGKTCEKILTIELGEEEVRREYEEFYRHIAPHAKVPGFRPGKAPRNVLAMHYGEEAKNKVLKELISHSFRQAIQEKTLEPLGLPDIQEVHFKEDRLSYQARIEIRPKIKLGRVTGLAAKKEVVIVKPEEVEAGLKRVQESLVQYKAVEDRPVQMGDFVIADYICSVEGREIESRTDDWFEIHEDEYLKGFSAQLIGAKPGEEKEIQITFPEKMRQKDLASKPALFKVKIKEIKVKILPELTDDLAHEAGEFKTLAELKSQIEKDLLASKEREKEVEFEKLLLDELLKHNKMELPEGLVSRRFEHLMHETEESFRRRGGPPEEFEKAKEKVRKQVEAEARRQVHVAFLLDEIAQREKIEVSEQEMGERIMQIAEHARQSASDVQKYYGEHEEAREALTDQIRNEKTIEFIKQSAKPSS